MATERLYKIAEDPVCGRQLIAKRKIHRGELIIDEPALLTGPGFARGNHKVEHTAGRRNPSPGGEVNDFTQEDASVCLVCCANLSPASSVQCPSCDLFLCSEQCKSHYQHTQNECLIYPKIRQVWNAKCGRSKKSLYSFVLVIRGLYYKFRDVTKWTQINQLYSKSEALEKIGGFVDLEDVLSSLSWDMFSASLGSVSSSARNENMSVAGENILDAAKHCLGVMRINAFSSFSESYCREGLFFISSFMSHSCIINTDRQIGVVGIADIRMVVRASVDIEKDEPITTTYLSLLYSTEERQRLMISSWLFMCSCKRCEDPMECEVFSGAIICQNKFVSDGRLVCCENVSCSCYTERTKESIIKKILDARPKDLYIIEKVENWLDTFDNGKLLHPNHSLFAHVKLFLCQFYGRQSGGLDVLSVSQLKRKVKYCLQIISIFDRVCPGIQMCQGVVLFELWCTMRRLSELDVLPLMTEYSLMPESLKFFSNPTRLTEMDISKIKKSAMEILQYALPNTSEEAMANCLLEEEDIYIQNPIPSQ